MPSPDQKAPVVLLVEDDPADQELTRRALEAAGIPGELRVARDGEEALDYLLRRGDYAEPASSPAPDLILLDLNLPKVDGRRVLETLRDTPDPPRSPVVVLTTSSREEDIERCYELGAKSFVTKPIGAKDFMRAVRMLQEYWLDIVALPPRKN